MYSQSRYGRFDLLFRHRCVDVTAITSNPSEISRLYITRDGRLCVQTKLLLLGGEGLATNVDLDCVDTFSSTQPAELAHLIGGVRDELDGGALSLAIMQLPDVTQATYSGQQIHPKLDKTAVEI